MIEARGSSFPTEAACFSVRKAPNIQSYRVCGGHHVDAVVECYRLTIRPTTVLCDMWLPCGASTFVNSPTIVSILPLPVFMLVVGLE
ncbi:hypothetical protein PISMIDRAFT_341800 [Pisolithus microcarpus 441]|uniref:Uncharacterized protein n=1 Tax=Pisolithus microcarpus 441 TaxID=765257 RepID=A0A0C9ZTL5_9AGAM|nr:hypothetical protein PISMIDRAFT_341800 [Pisolithus microcarpus 441]